MFTSGLKEENFQIQLKSKTQKNQLRANISLSIIQRLCEQRDDLKALTII